MNAPADSTTPANRHERIDTFADLEAGWLDSDGEVVSAEAIANAHRLIDLITELGLPLPAVFATEEGGVQAEWANPSRIDTVEFEPDGKANCMSLDATNPAEVVFLETDTEGAFTFVRENQHLFTESPATT